MARKKCRCTISPAQTTKIAAMMGSGFGLPLNTSPNLPENWLLNLPLRTRKTGAAPAEELTLRQMLERSLGGKTDSGGTTQQQGEGLKEHWSKHKGKYKAAAGLVGIAAAGAQQFSPQARSAATDAQEAAHTAGVVADNLQTARTQAQSGNVADAARSAQAAKREVAEAREYRDTRREAAQRNVQVPPRQEYQRQAATSSRQQAANVKTVAKAACMAQAAQQRKTKARTKAVQGCARQYGAGIFEQGTGLGRTGAAPLIMYRQMPMIGNGHGCSEMAGNGAYRVGQRGEGHGCGGCD